MAAANTGLQAALGHRYAVEGELGRGGMATVYRARDRKHDRPVAIKVMRPEIAAALGAERFLREIAIVARLQHPHVLSLIDSGGADDLLWYVMPFLAGETLEARLRRDGSLPLEEAIRTTGEIGSALAYAHTHGVVHRDIKPANIMLTGGHAVVMDFGIGRALDQPASARTVLVRHAVDPVPSVRDVRGDVPAAIDGIIQRLLAKDPADRFPDMAAMCAALRAATRTPAHGPAPRPVPTPPPPRVGPRAGRPTASTEAWKSYLRGMRQYHKRSAEANLRAIELNSELADAWNELARVYWHVGLLDAASDALNRAMRLEPGYVDGQFRLAWLAMQRGEYARAVRLLRTIPIGSLAPQVDALIAVAMLYQDLPEEGEAILDAVDPALWSDPDFSSIEAIFLAFRGRSEEAHARIGEAIEGNRELGHFHHVAYNAAAVYALLGEADEALGWLTAAAEDGFPCHSWFVRDPCMRSLRDHPRFGALIDRLKAEWPAAELLAES